MKIQLQKKKMLSMMMKINLKETMKMKVKQNTKTKIYLPRKNIKPKQ